MPRRPAPGRTAEVLDSRWGSLRPWLAALPSTVWQQQSVLAGWTVAELVAHLGRAVDSLAALDPAPARTAPLDLADYLGTYAAAAAEIAETGRVLAREQAEDPLGALDAAWERAGRTLARLGPGDPVVLAGRGPIRLQEFLVTRVVELVVHADDLARSLPDVDPPVEDRDARRLVVRALLDVVAHRAPGRSVEVRVPPFAAVQVNPGGGPGPTHTRGTPPAVVETDPVTWTRLAAGRETWSDAVDAGRVRASGLRTDLTPVLPVL